jgi:hypothetical protein
MKAGGSISIWFFIGVSLLFNGVLILAAGIYQYLQPPDTPTVLFNLHAGIWWGAILTLLGAIYCLLYRPSRMKPQ